MLKLFTILSSELTGQSYWCGKVAMILLGCSCCTDFPGQQDVLLQAEFFLFNQTAPCKAQVNIKTKLSKSEKAPWKCMGRKYNKNLDTSLGIVIFLTNAFKNQDNIPEKSEDLRMLVNWFLPSNTGCIIPGQICRFYHYMCFFSYQINISNICKVLWDSARKC